MDYSWAEFDRKYVIQPPVDLDVRYPVDRYIKNWDPDLSKRFDVQSRAISPNERPQWILMRIIEGILTIGAGRKLFFRQHSFT
jgi:hypothetical protein